MSDNIIHNELTKIKEKLAQCRLEEHKADHDKLIKLEEKVSTMTVELRKIGDTQVDVTDKLNEVASNLNLITDKVVQIVSKDTKKSGLIYTIIGGILITLIAGLITYMVNSTIKNLQQQRSDKETIEFIINKKSEEGKYGKEDNNSRR